MTDEKISQAEKDEAAYLAARAGAAAHAAGEEAAHHPEVPTLFDVQEMELNFGPQHPSTHGVLRLVLRVDGEKILEAKPDVGYLHRGTEKLFETETYPMGIPHTDRMDYIAAATNNHAFCLTIEKLLGVEIPRRAQLIRVILDELQRLSSHLVWLGTSGIDLGAVTPFWYAFREREQILDFFEEYCGARLTLNCMRIGGLPFDLTPGWVERVSEFIDDLPARIDDYEQLLTDNRIWKMRTVGIGVISAEECVEWGLTGPILRGSGLEWDLRRAQPYECYDELDFVVPTRSNGDTYDRYIVRVQEMRQSARILRQCLERLEPGEIRGKVPRVIKPVAEEVYASIESPKGELGFYCVSNGTNRPYRLHCRPPSFINLQALPRLAKGHLISDLVALIGTIDIVLGEVDRVKVLTPTVLTYIKVVLLVATVPAIVGFVIVLAERRLMGFMQARLGPNRVGPKGTLQGLADLLKLVTKEDVTPAGAEKVVHFLSPVLAVIPALTALALIPFGPQLRLTRTLSTPLYVTDVNVGLLFLLALTSIGVYGIILGGWSSNNKYSLLGGLRSAAQLVSYEVPMGLALVSVILMTRSLSLVEIVERQQRIHLWFVFPGLVAFFLYFVAGVAETNRNPFDLPEAESELVSGFNTEYSGVKFAFFFLGEYTAMIIISCLAVTLFFGGWLRPFPSVKALAFLDLVPPMLWFLLKTGGFLFAYIWFRSTFPRYRFDQLMALGWKWMIPVSLANIVVVAVAILATPGRTNGLFILSWINGGVFVAMALLARLRRALTKRDRLAAVPPGAHESA